jgi:hypothetical protein
MLNLSGYEEDIFCNQCGYFYQTRAVIDMQKSTEIKQRINKLISQNKLNEAITEAGDENIISTIYVAGVGHKEKILDWSEPRKLQHLEFKIKRGYFDRYFKFDNGCLVHKVKEGGGFGAYKIKYKDSIGFSCRSFKSEKHIKGLVEEVTRKPDNLEKVKITVKDNGTWKEKVIIS